MVIKNSALLFPKIHYQVQVVSPIGKTAEFQKITVYIRIFSSQMLNILPNPTGWDPFETR